MYLRPVLWAYYGFISPTTIFQVILRIRDIMAYFYLGGEVASIL